MELQQTLVWEKGDNSWWQDQWYAERDLSFANKSDLKLFFELQALRQVSFNLNSHMTLLSPRGLLCFLPCSCCTCHAFVSDRSQLGMPKVEGKKKSAYRDPSLLCLQVYRPPAVCVWIPAEEKKKKKSLHHCGFMALPRSRTFDTLLFISVYMFGKHIMSKWYIFTCFSPYMKIFLERIECGALGTSLIRSTKISFLGAFFWRWVPATLSLQDVWHISWGFCFKTPLIFTFSLIA